jgi:hypothetical protein
MKAWTRIVIAMTMGMMMGGNVANAGFIIELSETATGVTQATSGGTVDGTWLIAYTTLTNPIEILLADNGFLLGTSSNFTIYFHNTTLSSGSVWPAGSAAADSATGNSVEFLGNGGGNFLYSGYQCVSYRRCLHNWSGQCFFRWKNLC